VELGTPYPIDLAGYTDTIGIPCFGPAPDIGDLVDKSGGGAIDVRFLGGFPGAFAVFPATQCPPTTALTCNQAQTPTPPGLYFVVVEGPAVQGEFGVAFDILPL
jgi:hypothetical protein